MEPIGAKMIPRGLPNGGFRLPNGLQNDAWESILVSRGRLGGHEGSHKEVLKVVGNVVGNRPDFMSGRASPEDDGTKWGIVQAVGFSNIRISSSGSTDGRPVWL